jgi:hypothetical protein
VFYNGGGVLVVLPEMSSCTVHPSAFLSRTEQQPPIAEVIRCGVVPVLVRFLQNSDHTKLQVCEPFAGAQLPCLTR